MRELREPAIGVSGGRRAAANQASAAAGSGNARNASRQLIEATSPIRGMPTIHADGGPASARLTTLVRSSGSLHEAVAATPDAISIAIPAHIGTCARARSAKVGAIALASEPNARRALPALMSARGEKRASARPVASATKAASGAARSAAALPRRSRRRSPKRRHSGSATSRECPSGSRTAPGRAQQTESPGAPNVAVRRRPGRIVKTMLSPSLDDGLRAGRPRCDQPTHAGVVNRTFGETKPASRSRVRVPSLPLHSRLFLYGRV